MNMLRCTLLFMALALVPLQAAAPPRDETIFLFENRKVTIAVPAEMKFSVQQDARGLGLIQIGDPAERISMQVAFLPDSAGMFRTARSRKEFMYERFNDYVAGSVEQAMQFEELDPHFGAGTYCVFTDAKLVGQSELPPGEYHHVTTGLKAWTGVVAIFTLFSQDTRSEEYRAVMAMLRQSVEERIVPLR